MPKYRVSATLTGSIFVGEFEADTPEQAIEMAEASDGAYFAPCVHCSENVGDFELENFTASTEDGSEVETVQAKDKVIEGWAKPRDAKKYHYFFYYTGSEYHSKKSLCGGWLYFGDKLEDYRHDSLDNCKKCRALREKRIKETT